MTTVESWLGSDNILGIDIWKKKYQHEKESFDAWLDRVSGGDSDVKKLILKKKFLFGGRILANRGLEGNRTVSNCYVLGLESDSIASIYKLAGEMAQTYKAGGGVGIDLTPLAPAGAKVNNSAKTSTGAVSFIELFTTTTGLIGQCIEEHQHVMTPKGLVEIKDIKVGDRVWTCGGFREVIRAVCQGEKEVFEITTAHGYTVKATSNHVFVVPKGGELVDKQIGDVEIGDELVMLCIDSARGPYIAPGHLFQRESHRILHNKDCKFATDRLSQMTSVGVATTYDITLDDENRFWCEGFYVHNSGRRGALMICLKCDHPDIEDFIKLKTDVNKATTANLSIRVTDDFMRAVEKDEDWFTAFTRPETGECISKVFKARDLYRLFCDANYDYGEPGLLFWDKIESYNMLNTYENFKLNAVNPCGEESLPDGGACLLGSINLAEYVLPNMTFDFKEFEKDVATSVRALDTVQTEYVDSNPLEIQRKTARDWKQIGLGIMGLGDMLIRMNIAYGSDKSIELCDKIGAVFATSAVKESMRLGAELGSFPMFDAKKTGRSNFYLAHFKDAGDPKALRNSQILTTAPTGTISTMLGISGGIEPLFALEYERTTKSLDMKEVTYKVIPKIVQEAYDKGLMDGLVCASHIDYRSRIAMQAVWQKHIDASISSTINLPQDFPREGIWDLYMSAWKAGLKGVTVFRDGCKREGILKTNTASSPPDEHEIVGLRRTIMTGCGKLHVVAMLDRETGDIREVYNAKGSSGGCNSFMIGLSRMVSLSARHGATIDDIVDQLMSCPTCPSYAVRKATKGDTSPGDCCPTAIGKALLDMSEEVKGFMLKKGTCTKEISGEKCPECGAKLIHENSCVSCKMCGYSKCS